MNASSFQFHKGAIGVLALPEYYVTSKIFQFHKGAIGVTIINSESLHLIKFQFHKGAIGVRFDADITMYDGRISIP